MSQLRAFNTSIFLFIIFLIQETIVSRINFPLNGFSLYIAALMVVLSLEDRTGSLVFGFIGGVIMDLSIAADTPFGQWALVMTLMGYLFSINKESIGDYTETPVVFIAFISIASGLSLLIFAIVGTLLGEEMGGLVRNLGLIFANSLWTFLIIPLFLPLIIKMRRIMLTSREK
ncbi:MAG: rod shape-determining protein MreD [Candidatus Nanopelagicus sp.]